MDLDLSSDGLIKGLVHKSFHNNISHNHDTELQHNHTVIYTALNHKPLHSITTITNHK